MGKFNICTQTLVSTKCVWMTVVAFVLPIGLLTNYDPDLKQESKCAYVIIVMALLWLTEALPIAVTSLLPVFLFPMVGVAPARLISSTYFSDISMLLLGGLLIAMALEETRLHTRISLYVLVLVGAQPIMLMLGAMVSTWLLSFWINNTSATAMMIPIILAVCESVREVRAQTELQSNVNPAFELKEDFDEISPEDSKQRYELNGNVPRHSLTVTEEPEEENVTEEKVELDNEHKDDPTETPSDKKKKDEAFKALAKALCLSVAYGAYCGGIATITGTPPNLVLKDVADKDNGQNESPITFASWMGFALPLSCITLVFGWLWLSFRFLGFSCLKRMDPVEKSAINAAIKRRAEALGRISFAESQVVVVFGSMVLFWLFRNPPNISGWGDLFVETDINDGQSLVSDSTPCILLSTLLFILPEKRPNILCWRKGKPSYTPILKWQMVTKQLPWGVLILVGGGFAMARASQESGLSTWIGEELKLLGGLHPLVMNLLILTVVSFVTEVMSNPATAQLFVPILRDMSLSLGTNPLHLMISGTIACSFAFMLPVSAPPSAIVFATGYISIPDMALAGLPMKIIGIGCSMLAVNTWGTSMFDLDTLPDFLQNTNGTNITTTTIQSV
ncbi:solute carrier family 13 member 2-like isoform X2 [Mya arenaria]|uniref:solute carrier family 13 member 2-like isoform X2 n=1 Tax=Mya arenaria TaxID=6604 RepID=UPI0022E92CFC|nr:solute carrier family 13 member 2-like isoform X2 [Mya arenaria]